MITGATMFKPKGREQGRTGSGCFFIVDMQLHWIPLSAAELPRPVRNALPVENALPTSVVGSLDRQSRS